MKLPKNSERVFNGNIFEVFQWDQKMFDGSVERFEMLKRPDTVQILPTLNNKILVLNEQQPHTDVFQSLVGGRIDEGEEPLEAAKRELLEETGYESDDWELLIITEPLSKIEWKIYYFVARGCKKKKEQNLDVGEKIEILKVDFDEFLSITKSENFRSKDICTVLFRMMQNDELEKFKRKLF